MGDSHLLGRVLLRFGDCGDAESIVGELSAATLAPDGGLWLASDELSRGHIALSRLAPEAPTVFGGHRQFPLQAHVDLFDADEEHAEADIEGLDYADGYLWFTGSHASKRKKPKSRDRQADLVRLSQVEIEPNRYLLGRIPLIGGLPAKCGEHPSHPQEALSAARLAGGEGGNALIEALLGDPHLGPFLRTLHGERGEQFLLPLASKENGFDIEGLAAFGPRLFLGLRGPVLRGWAMLLAIEPELREDGLLGLSDIGSGQRRYRKHFLDLDGLGVRELSRDGEDLLILAGPTMALEGAMRIYRLRAPAALEDDGLVGQADGRLSPLFDVPRLAAGDHAEGMTPITWAGLPALLVVYDTPAASRRPTTGAVFADVFWMRD